MAKKVAKSLKALPTSELMSRILDPADPIDDVVADLKDYWGYDLYDRSPGPALLENGVMTTRDLDLACFLSALVDRGAVINLPKYQSRRGTVKREGEWMVSKDNRHGKITALTSNKDVFSFSVRVFDMNVMTSGETNGTGVDSVGAFRNFMLVDLNGKWYDGWRSIQFMPSAKENAWLQDKALMTWNKHLAFEHFIHPKRWTSFYGQWYVLTKIVIDRLKTEASFLRAQVKAILAKGVKFPTEGPDAEKEYPETIGKGETDAVKIPAFEAVVDGVNIPAAYPVVPATTEGVVAAKKRIKAIQYDYVAALSFAVRATELAFAQRAASFAVVPRNADGTVDETRPLGTEPLAEPMPAWINGATWERGWKESARARTPWNRLVLHQHTPFARGLAIRYRVHAKTERVWSPED